MRNKTIKNSCGGKRRGCSSVDLYILPFGGHNVRKRFQERRVSKSVKALLSKIPLVAGIETGA